jgi:hypothetical protein
MRQKGRTELPFEESFIRHKQMMASNRYALHVRDWQTDFGKRNVLVVLNDDLAKDSQAYLDSITDFIGTSRIIVGEAAQARDNANTIGVAPRSAGLARNARKFRFWLGSHRMYRTRRLLTKAGVWRFCFEGGPEFPPLDPSVKWRLRDLLRPEVEMLETLIHRDLSKWKNVISQSPELTSSEIIQPE